MTELLETVTGAPAPSAPKRKSRRGVVEWLTVALALVIYGSWLLLVFYHAFVPNWLLLLLGGIVIAWHSSFQHEVVHGHPTRYKKINHAFGFLPLSLWLPFPLYASTHKNHHVDERLTDPLDDPESKYLTDEQWQKWSPIARLIEKAQSPLLGRMIIGPVWMIGKFMLGELLKILRGDHSSLRMWLLHWLTVSVVLFWVIGISGMSLESYIVFFVYPGTAILMLRSFAEHRAAEKASHRTAIIEEASLLGLIFLNNNLHAVHHSRPALPWYELPEYYRTNREHFLNENAGLMYRGYGDVIAKYLFRSHDQVIHPLLEKTGQSRVLGKSDV